MGWQEAEEDSIPAVSEKRSVEHEIVNEDVENVVKQEMQESSAVIEESRTEEEPIECSEPVKEEEQVATETAIEETVISVPADLPEVVQVVEDVESQVEEVALSSTFECQVESSARQPEQEEESQLQIDETIEEMMKSGGEPAQEESQLQIEEMIEEMMKAETQLEEQPVEESQIQVERVESVQHAAETEEESQSVVEETLELSRNEIEMNEPVNEENQEVEPEIVDEEETSLQDVETIEEMLESGSVQEQTIAEDIQSRLDDVSEDVQTATEEANDDIQTIMDELTEDSLQTTIEDDTENAIPTTIEEVTEETSEIVVDIITPIPELVKDVVQDEQVVHEDESLVTPTVVEVEEQPTAQESEESNVTNHRLGSEERKMTVNVCGMDITAGMEDCGKMPTDLLPKITDKPHHSNRSEETDDAGVPSVYLEASIPPESHLVVSEAECSAQVVPAEQLDLDETEYETSPVVLSGKMTLSVIGMELNAEPAELQIEPKVEEPDAPRVRFPPQPTDRIFLIPVEPEEEFAPEDSTDTHVQDRAEDEDEAIDDSIVVYRPPTPPLQHDQETEFLTYDQLEEVGEVDIVIPEHPQPVVIKRLDSIPDADEEAEAEAEAEAEEFWSKDSAVDPSLLDVIESHIISNEEAEAMVGRTVPDVSDHQGEVESVPPVNDEHASIGEMVEKIRVAMEESVPEVDSVAEQVVAEDQMEEQLADVSSYPDELDNVAPEACSEFVSDKVERLDTVDQEEITTLNDEVNGMPVWTAEVSEQSRSIQTALNDMVDSIITESIAGSVAEVLRREECDNQTMIDDVVTNQVGEPSEEDVDCLEQSENVGHQLSERINLLPDSGTDSSVLMDVEYQIIPSSDSLSGTEAVSGEQEIEQEVEIDEQDFERSGEVTEMEHALEQIEAPVNQQLTEDKYSQEPTVIIETVTVVVHDEEEAEPSISGFTIREDFPDEEEAEPMTEEEILQARQEIEEIKKLLADVSSGVVHQPSDQVDSSNIVTELAYVRQTLQQHDVRESMDFQQHRHVIILI